MPQKFDYSDLGSPANDSSASSEDYSDLGTPVDIEGIAEKKKDELLSPFTRFLSGAASELTGMGQTELITPKVRAVLDTMKEASARADPNTRYLYPFIESVIENILGQAFSGNIAGATGATAVEAATYGAGKVAEIKKLGAADWFRRKAETQYGKVLNPTKELPKAIAETRVIPEALDRGVTAMTFGGLQKKVATGTEIAGQELNAAWKALPQDAKLSAQPLWDAADKIRQQAYVKGTGVLENPALAKQADLMQSKLLSMIDASGSISSESLRSWRQMMDKFVFDRKGFYLSPPKPKLSAQVIAKKQMSNAIREEIAKAYPDIKRINAEFSFWKNFEDILDATKARRVGQEGRLGRKVMMAGAIAAGLPHGLPAAALDVALVATADKVFRGPAWRTISAVTKNRLANLIASGNTPLAMQLLLRIENGTLNEAANAIKSKQ